MGIKLQSQARNRIAEQVQRETLQNKLDLFYMISESDHMKPYAATLEMIISDREEKLATLNRTKNRA